MVQARMPAITTPASSAGTNPWVDSSWAMRMMAFWDEVPPFTDRSSSWPAPVMLMATTPMKMATAMAMNTQMVATRRDSFSFLESSMAMNRSRMWGMPK